MTSDAASLDCPKCASAMRPVERSGVVLDVCTGCRGVFLDRGELERLIDAEGAYYGAGQPDAGRGPRDDRLDWDDRADDRGQGRPGQRRGRRGGFLGDLLDFGD